jgi:hypothetical protein
MIIFGSISIALGTWYGFSSIDEVIKLYKKISSEKIYTFPENINVFDEKNNEKKIFKIKCNLINPEILKGLCIMEIHRLINTYTFNNSEIDHDNIYDLFYKILNNSQTNNNNYIEVSKIVTKYIENTFDIINLQTKKNICLSKLSKDIPNKNLYLLLEAKDNIEHSNNNIILKRKIIINDIDYEVNNIKFTKSIEEYKKCRYYFFASIIFVSFAIVFNKK